MTPAGPRTATELLFGPGTSAAGALTQVLLSAPERALRDLPQAIRQAAVREAAAAAARLLEVELAGLLVTGWRAHHDLTGAARRTLASPGHTELVDLIRHQVTTAQEPSVTILVNGREVTTVQFSLTVEFDISALVAGIWSGLLVAVHAGSCEVTATLAVQDTGAKNAGTLKTGTLNTGTQNTMTLTGSAYLHLPSAIPVSPGIRLLPAEDHPAARRYPAYSERMS